MKGDMPLAITVVFGLLVVFGACLAAVAGLESVQRLVPVEKRQQHNEVAGFLYAVVGVVYAVCSPSWSSLYGSNFRRPTKR